MEKLYKGIHKFQESYFKKGKDFFKRLSKGQSPEALFITCVDSRIDPNLLTQSMPGRLLTLRNVGNIIPPYDAEKDKNSVAGALEFAVLALKVKDIIVCGHSDCGAIRTLFKEERELGSMPHLREWLKTALPVKNITATSYSNSSGESRQRVAEKENVSLQLSNIQTYSFVAQALKEGAIHLHGWYYDIGEGEVYKYNQSSECFEKIS